MVSPKPLRPVLRGAHTQRDLDLIPSKLLASLPSVPALMKTQLEKTPPDWPRRRFICIGGPRADLCMQCGHLSSNGTSPGGWWTSWCFGPVEVDS